MKGAETLTSTSPVLSQITTWLVQVPLLFYAVHGSFSFFSAVSGSLAVSGAGVIDTNTEAGSTRMVVWGSTAFVLLLIYPLACRAFSLFNRNRMVAALVLLAVVSVLWSQEPAQTAQKVSYLFVTTCFALYLVERFEPTQLMQVLMITGSIAMAASIVLAVAFPRFGIFTATAEEASGWQGLYSHKNVLGIMMVYFLTPAFFLPAKGVWRKLRRSLYMVAAVFLIAMSRSRGAWIMCACMFAFALIVPAGRRLRAKDRVAAYSGLATVMILGAGIILANLSTLLGLINKDITLTGRTTIWSVLLVSLFKHPLFGYGYSAFWVGIKGESANVIYAINWPAISYAENGVLELALELGLVGVSLFLLAYLQGYRRLRRLLAYTNGTPELFWYASILFLVAITNIEAGGIAYANSMEWLLFVITMASIQKRYQEMRQLEDDDLYGLVGRQPSFRQGQSIGLLGAK